MWKLETETATTRQYVNTTTGSKCGTTMVYTDKEGNHWWQFDDLMALPYTRSFAATKITSLFSLGLSKDDLTSHVAKLKEILKSADQEKYERAYAEVLDFETKALQASDAVRQMSSLVCVYFLFDNEQIDSFDGALQGKKMYLLEADMEMHAFFLNRQIAFTEEYTTRLKALSAIVLPAI